MYDSEHEGEIDLSCSSSSYNVHGIRSSDEEEVTDGSSEGSVEQPGVMPYQYESYSTDGEGDRSDENDDSSEASEDDERAYRLNNNYVSSQ